MPFPLVITILIVVNILGFLTEKASGLPKSEPSINCIENIQVPAGYHRLSVDKGSFAHWLRQLELRPPGTPVRLFNGKLKTNQAAHYAVLDIDTGEKDLQQCADAIIRLRAEYFFAQQKYADIHFNFTSGDRIDYLKWADGYRLMVANNRVRWQLLAKKDYSYPTFRKYLSVIFQYAGTASLSQELKPVDNLRAIRPGDVFIQGGFPGHAVLVIDVAVQGNNRQNIIFLLMQSYMPAQDMHIIHNPTDKTLTPWYSVDLNGELLTPEWTFTGEDLKRFP